MIPLLLLANNINFCTIIISEVQECTVHTRWLFLIIPLYTLALVIKKILMYKN